MSLEEKLQELGLKLPEAPVPVGSYRPVLESGGFAFLSGQISKTADGKLLEGTLGKELQLEDGLKAAEAAALNVVSIAKNLIDLERIEKLVRVVGYVQVTPDFTDIHKVMNGASDLFLKLFEDNGLHARSAVGVASLPLNAAVEVEATFKLKD